MNFRVFGMMIVGVIMAISSMTASASPAFTLRFAEIAQIDNVYRLDAFVEYALSKKMKAALSNGVKLTIGLDIGVSKQRSWWPDKDVAELSQRYQLSYHALSEHYLVVNLNTGIQESFADLPAALKNIGEVVNLPLIDTTLLDLNAAYKCRIEPSLDLDALPLPLRVKGYFSSGWRANTEAHYLKFK